MMNTILGSRSIPVRKRQDNIGRVFAFDDAKHHVLDCIMNPVKGYL